MSEPATAKKVPNHVILRIAGEVPADPATVRKVLAGQPVRGSVYSRICAALTKSGISFPAPVEAE